MISVDDVVAPNPSVNLEAPLKDLQGQFNFIVDEIMAIEDLITDLRERFFEYEEARDKLAEKIDEFDEELEEELEAATT
jgi:chromosome segregation ATPase